MSRLRWLIVAGSILVVLSALYVGVMVPFGNATAGPNPDRDPPPYSAPGPYPVGMRDLVIGGDAPLDVTLWYPALSGGDRRAKTRYAYEIKMGAPLGTVTFATYSGRAVRDAPYYLAAGPHPLVILSPGFSIGSSTYGWLAEHLASYGFVVMAPDHQDQFDAELNGLWQSAVTRPQDILALFAYVDDQVSSGGTLEGVIDAQSVAVVGHSYGGYTSLVAGGAQIDTGGFEALCQAAYEADDPGAWLCDKLLPHLADMADLAGLDAVPGGLWDRAWSDPRVDAIVPLAGDALFFGRDGLAEITAPVMAIGGTLDGDSPYMWGTYPAYEYASSATKARLALVGAEHMIFTGPCEASPLLLRAVSAEFCSDGTWDRRYAHDLVKHLTAAFLLDVLKGDQAAHRALLPAAVHFAGTEYTTTLR